MQIYAKKLSLYIFCTGSLFAFKHDAVRITHQSFLSLTHSISDSRLSKTLKKVEDDCKEKLQNVEDAIDGMERHLKKPEKGGNKEE